MTVEMKTNDEGSSYKIENLPGPFWNIKENDGSAKERTDLAGEVDDAAKKELGHPGNEVGPAKYQVELPAEDLRKLHGEIIQLMNQRFLLTTISITLFAGLVAAVVLKTPEKSNVSAGFPLVHQATTAYLFILIFISYQASCLRQHMREFNVYLRVRRASVWERDWVLYRRQKQCGKHDEHSCLKYLRKFVETVLKPLIPREKGAYDILGHDSILCGLGLLAVVLSLVNCFNVWALLPAGLCILHIMCLWIFRERAKKVEGESENTWVGLLGSYHAEPTAIEVPISSSSQTPPP